MDKLYIESNRNQTRRYDMKVVFKLKDGKEIERYFYLLSHYPTPREDETVDGKLENIWHYLNNKGYGGYPTCGFHQDKIDTITIQHENDDKPMTLDEFYNLISGCMD
jgi:hypothetical protein